MKIRQKTDTSTQDYPSCPGNLADMICGQMFPNYAIDLAQLDTTCPNRYN